MNHFSINRILALFLCLGLSAISLAARESTSLPEIPSPDKESQRRLYYQMKMRRYHRYYSKPATKNETAEDQNRPGPLSQNKSRVSKKASHKNRPPQESGIQKKQRSPSLPYYSDTPKSLREPVRSESSVRKKRRNRRSLLADRQEMRKKPKAHSKKPPKQELRNRLALRKTSSRFYSDKPLKPVDGRLFLQKTRPVPGFRTLGLEPGKKGPHRYYSPRFYKGIYLNNGVPRSKKRYVRLLGRAKRHQVNTLVVDIQPRIPSLKFMKYARKQDFYLVSRIVVYEGGLDHYPPSKAYIHRIARLARKSAQIGFMEVQLDYIRFSDYYKGRAVSRRQRYRTVATILKYVSDELRPLGIPLGADIFGRIPFNRHDRIGQNMEVFAMYLDTIYPMLYPSHFYGDKEMQRRPYLPVYYGVKKSIERIGTKSRIIAYIQAFRMHTKMSRLSYTDYIYRQMLAARDAKGAGFVAWNAKSQYATFFRALDKFNKESAKNGKNQQEEAAMQP